VSSEPQTFYTSRAWRIAFVAVGVLFGANGLMLVVLAPHRVMSWALCAIALMPFWVAWVETMSPIVELHADAIVIRTARLRPYTVTRPSVALIVERGAMGLGWVLRSADGSQWTRVPSPMGTQPSATVHIGRILGPDNERLGRALTDWIRRRRDQ
jgi:hypothetical protein